MDEKTKIEIERKAQYLIDRGYISMSYDKLVDKMIKTEEKKEAPKDLFKTVKF